MKNLFAIFLGVLIFSGSLSVAGTTLIQPTISQPIDVNGNTYFLEKVYYDSAFDEYCFVIKEFENRFEPCVVGFVDSNKDGFVFDSDTELLLKQRIDDIVYSDCVNKGQCSPKSEPRKKTELELLTERVEALETENQLLKNELCVVGKGAYSWCGE